jgi:hypothetical protein
MKTAAYALKQFCFTLSRNPSLHFPTLLLYTLGKPYFTFSRNFALHFPKIMLYFFTHFDLRLLKHLHFTFFNRFTLQK